MPVHTVPWQEYHNKENLEEKGKKKEKKEKEKKEREKEKGKKEKKTKEKKQKQEGKQKHKKGGWLRGLMGRSTSSPTAAAPGEEEQELDERRDVQTVRLSIAITFTSDTING
jgi:phage protein D